MRESRGAQQARIDAAALAFMKETGTELTDSGEALAPIFERIGFPLGLTDKGNLEINDDFLEATGHPIARIIQEHRDARKRANTYLETTCIMQMQKAAYMHR